MRTSRWLAIGFSGGVGLLASVSAPALATGQLPTNVTPVLYDIRVDPNAQAKTFTGSETITVRVRPNTRAITLNAADLKITRATLDGRPVRYRLDAATQRITLLAPRPLKGGEHRLGFAWSGKINDTAAGFFAIDYKNADGSAARMLATQFEAPDARRFAPMFDEPAFKAKFRLAAVAPANQLAYSNMPASVSRLADGRKLYSFAETPVMSSYLLFLGMGDVERKTVMAGKAEIGIITRRGVVDQGDYALASAKRLLTYYDDYFGQPYPLPKLDMIAAPGSSQFFGAMENWGAIFYFEPTVLFDAKRATVSGKQNIFITVAHEIAHQWFGNLVTMRWWDDLWLNEGFASWMENKASGDLNPEWLARETAVSQDREGAMGADSTAATHPIIRKVETVDQIGEAFDGITYQKGQAVIGMIESTLGADPFRDGIRRYMAKYKYGNTVTDQLWTELSAASGREVSGFAHDFTLQGGVPLIRVQNTVCEGGSTRVTLAQGRFGLDAASKQPQLWTAPLKIATLGNAAATTLVKSDKPYDVTVAGCGPLVVNQGKGSYVRVQYDDASHAALVRDYAKLALADRLGTLGDDFALAASGDQSLARYFELVAAVAPDASPLEWDVIADDIGGLAGAFAQTELEAPLRARTASLLAPVMQRVGFAARADEAPIVTNLRETLVTRLGLAGDADVAAQARRYVAALATDPNAIPPAIRQPILITYAANATPAEWEALLAITRGTNNPVAKNGYIRLLGTARDATLAERALALVKTSDFTAPQRAELLVAVSGRHPDMAFDFAVANLDMVNGLLETSTRAGFIPALGARSNNPAMPAKITAFAEANLPEASRGGAKRALTTIAARKAAADRLRPAVAAWLAEG